MLGIRFPQVPKHLAERKTNLLLLELPQGQVLEARPIDRRRKILKFQISEQFTSGIGSHN